MKTKALWLAMLAILVSSCRTIDQQPGRSEPPPAKTAVEIAPPQPPAEDLIQEKAPLLEPVQLKNDRISQYEQRRFSVDLQTGDVKDILRALVKDTDIGLIVDPDIAGTVPVMDLKEATLKDILSYILPPLHLKYRWEGQNIHVSKSPLVTRYFSFDYLAMVRKGKRMVSFSTRSNEGGTGSGGGTSGGTTPSASSGSASQGGTGSAGMNQSFSDISVNYENAMWNAFTDSMKTLTFGAQQGQLTTTEKSGTEPVKSLCLSDSSGKNLIISPATGIVLVTTHEDEMEQIARFIETYEGSAHRQVWIEAKILEVNLNQGYQMGIDWGLLINKGSYFGILDSKRTLNSPGMSFSPGDIQEDSLADTNGSFQLALSNNMLDFLVDALSRQGNVKVLASPKISTLNNEKAVIRVVREEAFFNLQTQVSQGLGGNVTAPTINVQIVPIGIVMDIVPQIAENGEVILSINPDISELLEVKKFEVQGASATQPVIERRSIDTVARVKDGETLVIAGIIKEKKTETLRGIPFLYKLPLIGGLFRRTEQRLEKTELVILITPKVIAGKSSAQLTSEEINRIEEAIRPMHLGDVFGLREGMQGEMEAVKKEKKK